MYVDSILWSYVARPPFPFIFLVAEKVYLPLIQQFFMLSNAHTQVLKSILTAIKANVFTIYITGTYKIHYSYSWFAFTMQLS